MYSSFKLSVIMNCPNDRLIGRYMVNVVGFFFGKNVQSILPAISGGLQLIMITCLATHFQGFLLRC